MSRQTKIGVLVPRESFLEQIEKVLCEEPSWRDEILDIKVVSTSDSLEEARKLIERGARIIVARGLQAEILKRNTNIPVVEIVTTTQEIGIMISNAKKKVKKDRPHIAMVSFQSSVSDITYIDEIFNVKFSLYVAQNIEELENLVRQAVEDGADIIIGGEKVGRVVEHFNCPYLFAVSTEDSIRNALDIARKMSYTADVERSYNAQVETILDSTFNGVIRIDLNKKILIINRMMEELLQKKSHDVEGNSIETVISVEGGFLDRVLSGRQESCLTSAQVRDIPIMVMLAPIKIDDEIHGAIVSCHKLKSRVNERTKTMQEMYLNGYYAKGEFEQITGKDKCTRLAITAAKRYALSRFPVLICGDNEAEAKIFAQSIHNNSLRKNAPFISVSCAHLSNQEQIEMLFGNQSQNSDQETTGILETAKYGTIFIRDIECMGEACQYKLFRILSRQSERQSDADPIPYCDVRLIAGTSENLFQYVKAGRFRKDLYYTINALTLKLPPLSERQIEIGFLVERYLEHFRENYSRYLSISEEALQEIKKYSWEGGIIQLEAFCERLFLSSTKKTVDRESVQELLQDLYSDESLDETLSGPGFFNGKTVSLSPASLSPVSFSQAGFSIGPDQGTFVKTEAEDRKPKTEKDILISLLHQYAGNRGKVAKELGISTTTLWRRMRKYGISE